MLPLTCMILNEYAGEKVVNLAITAIYSAVLVVGADLYAISLTALLLPFCVVVGLLLYNHFVYRPASKAHLHRQDRMKRIKSADGPVIMTKANRSKNESARASNSAPGGYFGRVCMMLLHNMQYVITMFSRRIFQVRQLKKMEANRMWRHMNRPSISQGRVPINDCRTITSSPTNCSSTVSPAKSPGGERERERFYVPIRRGGSRFSLFQPPQNIRNMVSPLNVHKSLLCIDSNPSSQRKSSFARQGSVVLPLPKVLSRQSSLLYGLQVQDVPPPESGQRIITRTDSCMNAIRKTSTVIVFDGEEAMARVRFNLVDSAPEESTESLFVTVSDLGCELQAILKVYYPDGIVLTASEMDEAYEEFVIWCSTVLTPEDEEWKGVAARGTDVVSFDLFEEWFIDVLVRTIHNITQDRLLNRALASVRANRSKKWSPRRAINSSSSMSSRSNSSIPIPVPDDTFLLRHLHRNDSHSYSRSCGHGGGSEISPLMPLSSTPSLSSGSAKSAKSSVLQVSQSSLSSFSSNPRSTASSRSGSGPRSLPPIAGNDAWRLSRHGSILKGQDNPMYR